ncbi:MAG TPA: APC family permease, partial [Stenomitos sp.]
MDTKKGGDSPSDQKLRKGTYTGHLVATEEASQPTGGISGIVTNFKHVLIGRPMPSAHLAHERITKVKALAVLSSDAISSTAYATEEILIVLAAAGAGAVHFTMPVTLAIVMLLAIVAYSYRQTIYKYPKGGGTYIVTKDNLGATPAILAGSALMVDYVLTVAVSISAGVAAVTSAFPALQPLTVELALVAVAFLCVANLRGVRESAALFTLPTYAFIVCILGLIGVGAWRIASGLPAVENVAQVPGPAMTGVGIFLVLRAFASGCSAMTGTEAISDGVPIFQDPQAKNAARTLVWMAVILATLFLGISTLGQYYHVLPREGETVVSQIARAVVGRSPFYYAIQATTALILVLAANTAFSDFPRLAYFMAQDRFMPRQFIFRGDRLGLSTGILALGILAGALIILVRGDVHHLIPLYAVGVFMAFTFSQASMVRRWWMRREEGWRKGLIINGIGALTTAIVTLVIAATKFTHGAWMILVLLPTFVFMLRGIHHHYQRVAEQLVISKRAELQAYPLPSPKTLVLISSLNKAAAKSLRYALALSDDVTALHVTDEPEAGARLKADWEAHNMTVPLVVLESPYRSLVSPIQAYLDTIQADYQRTPVTIVLNEFVPRHWWEHLLHNQ